jgi:hypothetical protein
MLGIFEATILSGKSGRRVEMAPSAFLRPMHPKTEIRPDRAAIEHVLARGWVGQLKIHGHRAQIHVSADPDVAPLAYNRHGALHKKLLPDPIIRELRRLFQPAKGWNVIDTEWLKPEGKLFVFDLVKREGELLSRLTYPERWALLPRAYISPAISTLPLLRELDKCLEVLKAPGPHVEGLVFKSGTTRGFEDTSIVRCRVAKSS